MTQTDTFIHKIQEHYARPDLNETILAALRSAGKDPNQLKAEDLAPLDEFHIRGKQATIEMAEKLNLSSSDHVLDVGSGLGGASRYLAATFGSSVTGIDLTEAYCTAAQMLAGRLDLDHKVTYRSGSALAIPFENEYFDAVWTQHASMNIADKARLYQEIYRVLKPGGTFALYDVLAGSGGPVDFPVPWSRSAEFSFLIDPDHLYKLLVEIGFSIHSWRDTTEEGRVFFNKVVERIDQNGLPPLGFHTFLGPDFVHMAHNVARALDESRIVVIEAVVKKPSVH